MIADEILAPIAHRPRARARRACMALHVLRGRVMDLQTIETLRRKLLDRRQSLLQRRRRTLADENELLSEREPDWEDAAAVETAASLLEGVGEAERREVARIQLALERIDRGNYGACAICRAPIDPERLRAVPDTDRCGRCAQ